MNQEDINTNNGTVEEVATVVNTDNDNTNTTTNEVTETPTPTVEPKTSRRRNRKASEEVKPVVEEPVTNTDIVIEVETPNTELDALKAELEAMKAEKAKLEEERKTLNETVTKLQEEVKITPQKLGKAIQEMGVTPLSMSRENTSVMTIEAYNAMSDTQRREWQRKNKPEFLRMMHSIKLNGL